MATELLLRRYSVSQSSNPQSLLSIYELGLFAELEEIVKNMKSHRSEEYNIHILPQCQTLIEAIGHRMAYDAAVSVNLDPCLIDLYVSSCIKLDAAWFAEKGGLSRRRQREMENMAIDAMSPRLEEFIALADVEPYITAPIFSSSRWEEYVNEIPAYGSSSRFNRIGARL